jgi:CRP-like cAMP-binding protein
MISSTRNSLLTSLSPSDFGLLQPDLKLVSMDLRKSMEDPNKPIRHVYFMEEGIASVVAVAHAKQAEVGVIGREGMSGAMLILGDDRSPLATYIQVAGQAHRMPAAKLRRALEESGTLRGVLLKFVESFAIQTSYTAIANARANIEQRLARWILMADDRLDGHRVPLTHELLSLMLAVRRPGVTVALQVFEGQKLITSRRGEILVVNRKGLERKAGEYYGPPEANYRRLFGSTPHR